MDDPKREKASKRKDRRSDEAPRYMQPQEPVLEEPLMGESEELDQDVEDETAGDEHLAERKSSPIAIEEEDSEQPMAEETPRSPYFPRGIYEDAQAVEEYYGRGEEKEGE